MSARELTLDLGGRWYGRDGIACCVAHDDRTPSLSVSERDGKLLVHCHAGCDQRAVIAALKARGLWGNRDADVVPWQPPVPKAGDSGHVERIWGQTRSAPGMLVD
jgi:hypothetical protein